MVAEYWNQGRLLGIQHLYVGVPSRGPGAIRPSHFDRIDDQTAHCVSGQNLQPGDYPVGTAIAHPSSSYPGSYFHLVNLPSPRRRMAYELLTDFDEAARLRALSRRTLDRFLAEKRPLSGKEILVAGQLDAGEVSRFVGKYFAAVDDRLPAPEERAELAARLFTPALGGLPPPTPNKEIPSLHGLLCEQLAQRGTAEAAAGLLQAIRDKRFLPPGPHSPRRREWITLLAIARRDPWPELDTWLASLVDRTERLVEIPLDAPELGATAAALLLTRRGQDPLRFGLKAVDEVLLPVVDLVGYRFPSAQGSARIHAWWSEQSSPAPADRKPNGA